MSTKPTQDVPPPGGGAFKGAPPDADKGVAPQAEAAPYEMPAGGSRASLNEPPGSAVGGDAAPPPGEAEAPELLDLEPEVAVIGEEDLTLTCTGEGFTPDSKIIFNGGEEPTTVVNDTMVTTIVKPSTAGTAGEFPVTVRNAAGESEPLMFEFVEPARASTAKAKPKKPAKVSKKKRR